MENGKKGKKFSVYSRNQNYFSNVFEENDVQDKHQIIIAIERLTADKTLETVYLPLTYNESLDITTTILQALQQPNIIFSS